MHRDHPTIGSVVTVPKAKLLDTLRKNRDEHRRLFEEALEGWQRQVTAALERAAQEARDGKKFRTSIRLPQPDDHTKDFDEIIAVVEWNEGETVLLDRHEFAQYVRNDWGWMPDFMQSVTSYAAQA